MSDTNLDIDSFWEYADPASSEQRFRAALESAGGVDRLALLTQIARTYSLRRQFDQAHAILDEVEPQLGTPSSSVQVRYLLERGRTYNSAGATDTARELFLRAWDEGLAVGQIGLAVDAAHMIAITYAGMPGALIWNQRGLLHARASADSKAQALIPAMLNNAAWALHDAGRYAEALELFEEACDTWMKRERPAQIQIARWSVARCLRSLGRYTDALDIHYALEAEHAAAGTADGYVFEEIAENLAALGMHELSRSYFARAADTLGAETWFVQHEPVRLAHLNQAAGRAKMKRSDDSAS